MDFTKPQMDQAWTRTEQYGRAHEPVFSGALSFCRRPYSRDFTAADVVVSGIPYDGATSHRPGTRFGPRAVRAASAALVELDAFPWGADPFAKLRVIDAGDCYLNLHDPVTIPAAIESHASEIIAGGGVMLTLGGDHFISYPLLRAHAQKYGKLALVQFDAHPDTWDMGTALLDHGTMFLRAAREGIIDVERSVQLGVRTHCAELPQLRAISAREIHRRGLDSVIDEVLTRVGDAAAYITFDIDCLDPSFAPGVGTPVPGGLSSWQALELVRALAGINAVGYDVVEVSPPYDVSEITAISAAHVAHDFICTRAFGAPPPAGG